MYYCLKNPIIQLIKKTEARHTNINVDVYVEHVNICIQWIAEIYASTHRADKFTGKTEVVM